MRQEWKLWVVVGLLMVLAVGCAAPAPEATPTSPAAETPMEEEENTADATETPEPPEDEEAEPESTTPVTTARPTRGAPSNVEAIPATDLPQGAITGEVPEDLLEEIMADLVDTADVSAQDVEVLQAEAVTWSDGSLGCPQPGMFYTQMLVSGYRVVLSVDGKEYDYHASDDGQFFLCEGASGGMSAPSSRVTPLGEPSFPEPPDSEPDQ